MPIGLAYTRQRLKICRGEMQKKDEVAKREDQYHDLCKREVPNRNDGKYLSLISHSGTAEGSCETLLA